MARFPSALCLREAGSPVSKVISSDDPRPWNQARRGTSECRMEPGCPALLFRALGLERPVQSRRDSAWQAARHRDEKAQFPAGASAGSTETTWVPAPYRFRLVHASTFLLAGPIRTQVPGKETQTFPQIEPRKDLTRPFKHPPHP